MKSRITAGLLALFVGFFGIHKFYLKQIGLGIIYLLFCWTGIPGIIALIEGIIFLSMSDDDFNEKYNGIKKKHISNEMYNTTISSSTAPQPPSNITIQQPQTDIAQILVSYKNLLDSDIIAREEFDIIKRKVLGNNQLSPTTQISLNAICIMLQELQQYKRLFEDDIISAKELSDGKANILSKYGLIAKSNIDQSQKGTPSTQIRISSQLIGTYKHDDILLLISKSNYNCKDVNSNSLLFAGTYMLNPEKQEITLFKPDKSVIKLHFEANGNLTAANGNVYERQ